MSRVISVILPFCNCHTSLRRLPIYIHEFPLLISIHCIVFTLSWTYQTRVMSTNYSRSYSSEEEALENEVSVEIEGAKLGDQEVPLLPRPTYGASYTIEEILRSVNLKRSLKPRVLHNGKNLPPTDDILIPRLLNPSVLPYPLVPGWLMHPDPKEPTLF